MSRKSKAVQVAYPAILGALAVALVYLAAVAPTGRWGIVALGGLLPAAAVIDLGMKAGLLCWAGASILSFLLVPDKFCVLLFTALFGLYPMVKSLAEGLKNRPAELLLKLAFFNAAFTLLNLTMAVAVAGSVPKALGDSLWALYPAANIVFALYDYGFSRLIAVYMNRVRRAAH